MTEIGEGAATAPIEIEETPNICEQCLQQALKSGAPFAAVSE